MRRFCFFICFPLVLFLLFATHNVSASDLDAVVQDFKTIAGYVVADHDGDIIVDLGSDKRISKGDLFTVFHLGKKLTDPVTGKELGYIKTKDGVLKVVNVEAQFSYTTPVGPLKNVKRGDEVVRFKNIDARAVDTTGKGEHFLFSLRKALPGLDWLDTDDAKATLTFTLQDNLLVVRDVGNTIIREYPIGATAIVEQQKSGFAPVYDADSAGGSAVDAGIVAASTAAATTAAATPGGKISYDLETYGYEQGGKFDYAIKMADFLQLQDKMHVGTISEHGVEVYVLEKGSVNRLAQVKLPFQKLLAVAWWQPATGGTYLAVTSYDEDELDVSSVILKFDSNGLTVVKENFNYILGSSDVDGNGSPETLLAQNFDLDTFFGRTFRQVRLAGNGVTTSQYDGPIPSYFRVSSGVVYQPSVGNKEQSAFVMANKLFFFAGQKMVYESSKEMGGSLSAVKYVQNPDRSGSGDANPMNPLFSNAQFEIRPLAVDVDLDGIREVVVPSADLSAFSMAGRGNAVKQSWLSIIKQTGSGSYMKGKLGGMIDRYIQGIGAANGKIYMLTTTEGSLLSLKATDVSQILILPLN